MIGNSQFWEFESRRHDRPQYDLDLTSGALSGRSGHDPGGQPFEQAWMKIQPMLDLCVRVMPVLARIIPSHPVIAKGISPALRKKELCNRIAAVMSALVRNGHQNVSVLVWIVRRPKFGESHDRPLHQGVRFAILTRYLGRARSRRIERTRIVLSQCEAHENADGSCSWYGDH